MSTELPVNPESGKGRVVLWLLALGVPLLLLVAWWPASPKPRPALPNPNGYDYFVEAGGTLAGIWTNASPQSLTAAELQAFLSANQASLDLVREGLRHQSHTSVDYDATYIGRMMTVLSPFKQCGRLLVGEGWLAESEGNPASALDSYLDALRLGQECSRGGIMMERLVGIAIETSALLSLRSLLNQLKIDDVRRAQQALEKLDARHDLPSVTLASEEDWVAQAHPAWTRLIAAVHPNLRKSTREVRVSLIDKVNALQMTRRRAIVEAAARLFELEKGSRPTGYADLVPAYLKAVPLDPATGKEIAHPF